MPCRCDYMEPTEREKETNRVRLLLREMKEGKAPTRKDWARIDTTIPAGFDVDKLTAELCGLIQSRSPSSIKQCSLELQIWWRDHQEADRKRIEAELEAKKDEICRKRALAKLTLYERKLLRLEE